MLKIKDSLRRIPKDKTLYLSAPMTGKDNFNRKELVAAQETLASLGYKRVLNPATMKVENEKDYTACLRQALKLMLDADVLVQLDDWGTSKGCKVEAALASLLDIPLVSLKDLCELEQEMTALEVFGDEDLTPEQREESVRRNAAKNAWWDEHLKERANPVLEKWAKENPQETPPSLVHRGLSGQSKLNSAIAKIHEWVNNPASAPKSPMLMAGMIGPGTDPTLEGRSPSEVAKQTKLLITAAKKEERLTLKGKIKRNFRKLLS